MDGWMGRGRRVRDGWEIYKVVVRYDGGRKGWVEGRKEGRKRE
jgi:hypothetical protein